MKGHHHLTPSLGSTFNVECAQIILFRFGYQPVDRGLGTKPTMFLNDPDIGSLPVYVATGSPRSRSDIQGVKCYIIEML